MTGAPDRTAQDRTEALIARLAVAPVPPGPGRLRPALLMAAALVLAAVPVLAVIGPRADLATAVATPEVAAKWLLAALALAAALPAALALARPAAPLRLWPLWIAPAAGLALILWRMGEIPSGTLAAEVEGTSLWRCLGAILMLSALPLAAGLAALRRGAPTRPALTGAVLGLAAGAGAAFAYAFHCTEDSPLFYVTWYGLGIALAGGAGAVLGARILRW